MSERPSRPIWPLLGLAAFLAASITLAVLYEPPPKRTTTTASVDKGRDAELAIDTPSELATATLWVEVNQPQKVHQALFKNAWLQDALQKPLGKGFFGGWAPFLGSRGEDLKASFSGRVLELVAGELLRDPYRVVFLATQNRPAVPVLVIDAPSSSARAAFAAMDAATKRGVYKAKRCPQEEAEAPVLLTRWHVAEQSVFAVHRNGRMVLGRTPQSVLQGTCAALPSRAAAGSDVAVVLRGDRAQRAAQTFASALGVKDSVALGFRVDQDTFVPTGLTGALTQARLAQAPLAPALLRLVPEEVPVLLALNVQLPEQLDENSLRDYFSGKSQVKTAPRQVAVAWTPRGDRNLPAEIAIAWGKPEDAPALSRIFSGNNALTTATHCGHVVLASSEAVLSRFAQACAGKLPSLANAAPQITAGLSEKSSVALGIHLGKLTSQLTQDGYLSDSPASPTQPLQRSLPPEIEAARKDLESLPYVGFRGVAEGGALVGGGFRS